MTPATVGKEVALARLQYLVAGEYARVGPDGLTTIVGAGFDRVSVQGLPAQQMVGLALRVLLDRNEKDVTVTITLRPPTGYQMVFNTAVTPSPDARPVEGLIGVPVVINLPVPILVAGTYRLSVATSDQDQGELAFEVEVREQAPQVGL